MTGNWHVMGAGAQGLLFYAYAAKAGQSWTMIARQCPIQKQINYTYENELEALPLDCKTLSQCGDIHQVIVCVKTTQLDEALAQLKPHLRQNATVVLALNGVGWQRRAATCLSSQRLLLLSSLHGSYRPEAWSVVDSNTDSPLFIGPGPGTNASATGIDVAHYLDHLGLHCSFDQHIEKRLWLKAAINACINPLTALLNCRNGELLGRVMALELLPRLYQEISHLLQSLQIDYSAPQLEQAVLQACRLTSSNYSSMQQDYRLRRATEIDAIVGAFIDEAQKRSLPCPTLTLLHNAILAQDDWTVLATGLKLV